MDGEFGLTVQKSDTPHATLGWRLAEGAALIILLYCLASNLWLQAIGAGIAVVLIYALWRRLHPGGADDAALGKHHADSSGDSGGD